MRVLVADDDELTSSTLARILARAGHEVRTAASAAEVQEQVKRWPPDVVIIDRRLGDDDGLVVGRSLHGTVRRGPRLLLLSGEWHAKPPPHFDAVLLKPVGPRDVLAAVAG